MFWQKKEVDLKKLAAKDVLTERQMLDELHKEGERIKKLQSLLTDVRKFKDSVKFVGKKRSSTTKRKSPSRK